jgi:flagellar motility protein MotE (MotC chaperone)
MPEREVARFGAPVLNGLMFAHAKRVVHRDVKPLNILVGPDNSVCLVDFGTAKPVGAATAGLLIGTLEYMAPERLAGDSGEEPSDIWSLGCVFYYALTKRSPFNRLSLAATATSIGRDTPSAPGDGPLARLVMRMLDKNPVRRPRGEEVHDVLRLVLGQRPKSEAVPPAAQDPVSGGNPSSPGHPDASGPGKPVVQPHDLDQMSPQEAAMVIAREAHADAAALLLHPAAEIAARILRHCPDGHAGELIALISTTHQQRAGRILEGIEAERAGVILSRMDRQAAARVLAAMHPAAAAERLREADTLMAGIALGDMPAPEAGSIVEVLNEEAALRIMHRIHPATCAAILKTLPNGRGRVLASRFRATSFRRSVQEMM